LSSVETEPRAKARALVTAEAIIAGFLFTTATIQYQALHSLWEGASAQYPISTFFVTLVNYALIVVTFRCIWLALQACDMDKPDLYKTSYTLFITVLLLTVVFVIVPAALSISKGTIMHDTRAVTFPYEKEYSWAYVCASVVVVFACVFIAFRWPTWTAKVIRKARVTLTDP
jgi:hypothetical protein